MENIVAVAIELEDGNKRYFITWGRIQDSVDPAELEKIILKTSLNFNVGGKPIKARLCDTLQDASKERYFYESFFSFCQRKIPYGEGYQQWREEKDKLMRKGKEISFCGYYPDEF